MKTFTMMRKRNEESISLKEFNVKRIDAIKLTTEGILLSASCFLNIDKKEIEGEYKKVILVKEDGTAYVVKKE